MHLHGLIWTAYSFFVEIFTFLLILQHDPQEMGADPTINSIDFHRTRDLLVTASNDETIRVYDTCRGTEQERPAIMSKKYGVTNICYTHDPNSVIYSSSKVSSMSLSAS